MGPTITVDGVRAAAERILTTCVRTPLVPAPWSPPGTELWLKPESLQPTGAFKLRGATNAVACLDDQQRSRGVVSHSSGNHGWALAYAAAAAGVPATVVVPHRAPEVKVDAIRSAGAEVVRVSMADRVTACAEIAGRTGAVQIPPFDHPDVVAGQGTVGLEIAADRPDVETVLVPVGGGGLIAGVAVAVKALLPGVRVLGCEPALAADAAESLRAGTLTSWSADDTSRTIADGLRVPQLGDITWPLIRRYVDDIVTVSEEAIAAAVARLAHGSRLVVEPSGAVTSAAVLESAGLLPGGRTVAVVSGGNLDPEALRGLLGCAV